MTGAGAGSGVAVWAVPSGVASGTAWVRLMTVVPVGAGLSTTGTSSVSVGWVGAGVLFSGGFAAAGWVVATGGLGLGRSKVTSKIGSSMTVVSGCAMLNRC